MSGKKKQKKTPEQSNNWHFFVRQWVSREESCTRKKDVFVNLNSHCDIGRGFHFDVPVVCLLDYSLYFTDDLSSSSSSSVSSSGYLDSITCFCR